MGGENGKLSVFQLKAYKRKMWEALESCSQLNNDIDTSKRNLSLHSNILLQVLALREYVCDTDFETQLWLFFLHFYNKTGPMPLM